MGLVARKLKGTLLRPFLSLIRREKGLVVITLHNIRVIDFKWFDQLMQLIKSNFGFATVEEIGFRPIAQPPVSKVVLTFDDGFSSNRILADKILSKYGVKAIFFVTEGFIGLGEEESLKFAQRNLYPNSILSNNQKSECKSMSWDDVGWLVDQGHTIGAHTRTHPKLSSLAEEECFDEIIKSADQLEKRIAHRINHFAFPFGTMESVNRSSIKMATGRFEFVFSNVRGSIEKSPGNHFLFRQNLVPGDPLWLSKAMIEGRLDWRYRKAHQSAHSQLSEL